ncbi:Las1-like protein, partial [Protomyces lactucae-debilis]
MRITPWRDQREWERVRDLFYSQDPAMIQLASDRVRAWACRGRVAHAVISTHLLTAALQMRGSSLECRMVLAMALTRFVNGLLDPAQQAEHAISMVALARQLDLPESFVELRHATTHDALPSLVVLKQAAMRARDWLWQHYWQPV